MKRFIVLPLALAIALPLARDVHAQTKVTRTISNETVEKILQSMQIQFKKGESKDNGPAITFYDFTRNGTAFRLKNYNNDLWIESTQEKKMKLEDVNRWNAQAKFSRLVLIEEKAKTTVSLEAQLDCLGGVTDATVRHFINRFDEEAKKFAKFVK